MWRAIWFERRLQPRILTSPKCAAATRPGRTEIGESRVFSFSGRRPRARKPEERAKASPQRLKCSYTQCPPSCHWRSLKNYVQSWRRWCQAQQKNCISVAVRQFRPGGFQNGKLSAASRNWAVPRVHCSVFEARATTTRLSYRQPTSYKKSPGERVSKDSVQRS